MKLAEPGPNLYPSPATPPPIPDSRPINRAEYHRATGPSGSGTVTPTPGSTTPPGSGTPLTPPSPPTSPPVQALPDAYAEHAPPTTDPATRSIRLQMAVGDDGLHESGWLSGIVNGEIRMIKFATAIFTRKDAVNYYVELRLRVYNSTGTQLDPTEIVLYDVPLTPVAP